MPTNTDLVTDLPADFEVFGQAVDTTLADLKGGTSGQILSKATNADMDFVWIANDQGDITGITATSPLTGGGTSGAVTVGIQSATTSQSGAVQLSDSTSTTSSVLAATPTAVKSAYDLANTANTAAGTAQTTANTANSTANAAIPKSTITAKGSIVTATASSTPANLSVGNNGEYLVADSNASTGLRYQGHIEAGKNALINGSMDIWQRSTSSTTSLAYTADRWFQYTSAGTTTFSRESTIVPTGSQYSMKIAQASASATITVNQAIETLNAVQYAGQTVSVSMMCYASASTGMQIQVAYSTSTDVGPLGSWTSITASSGGAATITNAWQKMIGTYAIPSTAKSLYISLYIPSLTATTNAYFGQAMLELGSVPTQFSRAGGNIAGELAACQRYYYRTGATDLYGTLGVASCISNTSGRAAISVPVPMRVIPTSVDSSTLAIGIPGSSAVAVTSVALSSATNVMPSISFTFATNFSANQIVMLTANNSTSAYVGFSAEL